jgi:hypothetical protein
LYFILFKSGIFYLKLFSSYLIHII